MADNVPFGTPITSHQAARAVLRMIKSPIIGDLEQETIGRSLDRLDPDGTIYPMLSKGEQSLVRIAIALYWPHNTKGAQLSVLGSLDPDNRRRVIVVLAYLHLGRDSLVEVDDAEWVDLFEKLQRT